MDVLIRLDCCTNRIGHATIFNSFWKPTL